MTNTTTINIHSRSASVISYARNDEELEVTVRKGDIEDYIMVNVDDAWEWMKENDFLEEDIKQYEYDREVLFDDSMISEYALLMFLRDKVTLLNLTLSEWLDLDSDEYRLEYFNAWMQKRDVVGDGMLPAWIFFATMYMDGRVQLYPHKGHTDAQMIALKHFCDKAEWKAQLQLQNELKEVA